MLKLCPYGYKPSRVKKNDSAFDLTGWLGALCPILARFLRKGRKQHQFGVYKKSASPLADN